MMMKQHTYKKSTRHKLVRFMKRRKTPVHVVERDGVHARHKELQQALLSHWGEHAVVAYSFKTNPHTPLVSLFKSLGARAEVVSWREYQQAIRMGYREQDIVFNGPFKSHAHLRRACLSGAIVHVDNGTQVADVVAIAQKTKKRFSVGLRLQATRGARKVPSRFGFSIDDGSAEYAVQQLYDQDTVDVNSVHMHIGTDIDRVGMYQLAARRVGAFVHHIEQRFQVNVRYIDMGGGFPSVGRRPHGVRMWRPQTIGTYIEAIAVELKKYGLGDKTLLVEPGRYLVDDAGSFVTRVIHTSDNTIIVDGTISMVPLAYYRPQIVGMFTQSFEHRSGTMKTGVVYGSTCQEEDVLYKGPLPVVTQRRDYCVFFCTGAYNRSMGGGFIFDTPAQHVI